MITKHGTVTITDGLVHIEDFTFDMNGTDYRRDAEMEAVEWAMEQLRTTGAWKRLHMEGEGVP